MPGNRIKETSTTTGTGDLTLAGAVTDYITFDTEYSTTKNFPYTIIDTTNNVWESGFGYLSASTTLVRDKIVDNSSGGATALTLSAGTKDVISGLHSHCSGFGGLRGVRNMGTTGLAYGCQVGNAGGTNASTVANKMYLMPFWCRGTFLATGVTFEVDGTTAANTDVFRFGLYDLQDEGEPHNLIATTADVDLSTDGTKSPTFSANTVLYGGEWYYVAFGMTNTLVPLEASSTTHTSLMTPLGCDTAAQNFRKMRFGQHNLTGGWTALPALPDLDAAFGPTTNQMIINVLGSV